MTTATPAFVAPPVSERPATVVRSNYYLDASAALYEHSLKLWEGLTHELNFNLMFSQRGVVGLAFTRHELIEMERRVEGGSLTAAAIHVALHQIMGLQRVGTGPRRRYPDTVTFPYRHIAGVGVVDAILAQPAIVAHQVVGTRLDARLVERLEGEVTVLALVELGAQPGALAKTLLNREQQVVGTLRQQMAIVPEGEVELIAGPPLVGDDLGVLQLGHAFEQATGFGRTRPRLA